MRGTVEFGTIGLLAGALLLLPACSTLSGSSAGDESMAQEEFIPDPVIKEIPPPELTVTSSPKRPSMRAELAARNATGFPHGALPDVLFDFDRASLREDALDTLQENAKRLKESGATILLLEGRGDEIGTAAYNIVLGDRRAKRVRSFLEEVGLTIDVRTTSYGKDRPLCFQHTSDCLQKNRSVHFVVKE